MNKTDLVNEIAAKAKLNKVDAKAALDAVLESIAQALSNDDKVQLIGFGTFSVMEKEARTGINPRTKEKIEIPARKVVKSGAFLNRLPSPPAPGAVAFILNGSDKTRMNIFKENIYHNFGAGIFFCIFVSKS